MFFNTVTTCEQQPSHTCSFCKRPSVNTNKRAYSANAPSAHPRLIIQNEILECGIRRRGSEERRAESGFETNSHTNLILIGLSAAS